MIWKAIIGYEGSYEVSENGDIKSCSRILKNGNRGKHLSKEMLLKQKIQNGYYSVTLYKNNKSRHFYVHRLVAIAFLDNPFNKNIVNHKDGEPLNNKVENLEWVNNKEHTILGINLGQIPKFKLSKDELEKLYIEEKKSIAQIANIHGVSPSTISIRLNQYGIKKRSLSEQAKLRYKDIN